MDPAEDLQHAIDWYLDAVPPSSVGPPEPPQELSLVEATIAEAEAAIAPSRLPTEVTWLWRAWDPTRLEPLPYPRLTSPGFALDCWRSNAIESGEPRILFPVAYESHGFLLVELGGPAERPAPVWSFAYTDDWYVLRYPSLASLFRACAEAAEVAAPSPPIDDNDRYEIYAALFAGPAFDAIAERHMGASPHATRERRVPVGDVRGWPEHWQRAQGLDEQSLVPRGATHTVAELVQAAAAGPVVARVIGRYRAQGGGGLGPGGTSASFGSFTDPTGSITVLVPDSVTDLGGRDGAVDVEIEVEAAEALGSPPDLDTRDIQDAALAGDLASASTRAGELGRSLQDAAARMPVVRRMVPLRA